MYFCFTKMGAIWIRFSRMYRRPFSCAFCVPDSSVWTWLKSSCSKRNRNRRARARLFLFRFENELFSNIDAIEGGTQKQAEKARQIIRDNLTQIAPVFVKQKYMLGEEFSMLDVAIAPLLWRLDHYQVQLNKQSAPLLKYAERLFSRQAFIDSMTASEKAMRR